MDISRFRALLAADSSSLLLTEFHGVRSNASVIVLVNNR